jgi:hypothetical protein
MTDERAVQLANLLAEYAAESVKEGATFAEVRDWTIGQTVGDIVDTTPDYLLDQLNPLTQDIS